MKLNKILNKNFCNDSRLLKKGDVFFDFLGNKKKINPYLKTIIKKKPYLIVSNSKLNVKNKVLIKKNVKFFFFKLIHEKYKKKLPKNLVAVTGTNGKTSIAHFFYQIHNLLKIKCGMIGTLGFHGHKVFKKNNLTTPDSLQIYKHLSIFKKEGIQNVIIEASSHGLDQNRLNKMKFRTAVFTNFTQDHLDYHKTMDSYLNSKLILFKKHLKKDSTIIFNKQIFDLIKKKINLKNYRILGLDDNQKIFKIISIKSQKDQTLLKVNFRNKIYITNLHLVGKIQILNLMQAVLCCLSIGISFIKIIKILKNIKPVFGRLNIFRKKNKLVVLDYAHTPDGIKKVIETLKSHYNNFKINIVFGCGGQRDVSKRAKMGKIANDNCNKIYITDDNPRNENPTKIRKQIKKFCKKAMEIGNRRLAIKTAIKKLKKDELLIVAGKGHENYQIINGTKKPFSDYLTIKNFLKIYE